MFKNIFGKLVAKVRFSLKSKEEIATENEVLVCLVLKSMKDKDEGKVITSKALHERLAKMKEELK